MQVSGHGPAIRLTGLGLALLLGACASPGYYLQAMAGHYRVMAEREPVEELLAKEAGDSRWAERLQVARDALAFAERVLELPAEGAYDKFSDTGRQAVVWNVVATPEFSLEPRLWCFPVAGCVPYRGYFERDRAEAFAAKMERRNRDVTISPVTAYSSLGWFEDPLLNTMLVESDASLAGTLFHELAHRHLYLAGDTAFSESYATFLERQGVADWLRARGREAELRDWLEHERAVEAFLALLRQTRDELDGLYASSLAEAELRGAKAEAFRRLRVRHDRLVAERLRGRFDFSAWFSPPPNNADLALIGQYEDGVCAFRALFEEADGDYARFHQLATQRSELEDAARLRWLAQPCPGEPGGSAANGRPAIASDSRL
jgi:predicted aminopeptidase